MSRAPVWPWLLMGGTLAGGALIALATAGSDQKRPRPEPDLARGPDSFSELDVEAAARMLASENPDRSQRVHIEQIWTQLRARKAGQSLFDRITAGSGWGPQGEKRTWGGVRPVATTEPATDAFRKLAREVLAGQHPSELPGAKKFWEPALQDKVLAVAERGRQKQMAGLPLTPQEKRLAGYKKTASQVRADWTRKGSRVVETLEGVEFLT